MHTGAPELLLLLLLLLPHSGTTLLADAASSGLFDSYAQLQFRNPAGLGESRARDTITRKEQCVLYSEIDHVTSIEKGWDVVRRWLEPELPVPLGRLCSAHGHSVRRSSRRDGHRQL